MAVRLLWWAAIARLVEVTVELQAKVLEARAEVQAYVETTHRRVVDAEVEAKVVRWIWSDWWPVPQNFSESDAQALRQVAAEVYRHA